MKERSALALGERLEVEAALDAAFAPLRESRTDLSPLRVRAAVRWGRGAERTEPPSALRWSGAIRRLSELSVAVGMSVMLFGAAIGPAVPQDTAATRVPIAATPVRTVGATIEEQMEIHATKHEWVDSLRARLEALRAVQIQDWLDPTVVRPVLRRLDVPGPRTESAGRPSLY